MRDKKQITSICNNCEKCGLPVITCICNQITKVNSEAKFIILSSEKEIYRNTNTAALLKLVNPKSTEIITWRRGEQQVEVIKYINSNEYNVYLIFPAINEELEQRKIKYVKGSDKTVFIIIDGTWKEAWKIIRKSEYLNNLPIVALDVSFKSKFSLRKGQDEGNLCTIETAIELLKLNSELDISKRIDSNFDLFLKAYKSGASGHKIY